jgi:uncharacterized membrane protein
MNPLLFALTLLSALGSGLVAGLFFIFSVTIMDALGRLPPAQGIAAMQSINVVILNPIFFAVFFGTAALCLVLAIWSIVEWQAFGAAWLLAGSLLYIFGAIVVTMVFNVPMNDALAAIDPASEEGAGVWARYLIDWTRWNHVRTLACLGAAAALIVALYLRGRMPGSS